MSVQSNQNEPKPAPGYYNAKIINYGIKATKNGDPAPTIMFEVEVDGGKHRVFWQGSLKDGIARDICLKALAICGFKHVRHFPNLAEGPETGLLDMENEVQITVDHENSIEDPNKKYARVRWINEKGGGKFKNALNANEAFGLMQNLGLEADFMRIAGENNFVVSSELIKRRTDKINSPESDLDIPF